MSALTVIQAVLVADNGVGGVYTLLTGGIYRIDQTGINGIDSKSVPSAYDSAGKLKPTALLKMRDALPYGGIRDGRYKTTRQVLEIYLYREWVDGYSTLYTARERIDVLLDEQRFSGVLGCHWINNVDDKRAPELAGACMIRADYELIGAKGG